MNISIESIGSEPVTSSSAKTWLRLDTSDHDTEIGELITEAREWFETQTGRLVEQRAVTLELDAREIKDEIRLPYGPVVSITSIKVWDDSAGDWGSDIKSGTHRIIRTFPPVIEQDGSGWPTEVADKALQIVYEAGETPSKRALYLIKAYIIRAYDEAGAGFGLGDLEKRAIPLSVNPIGFIA